MVSGTRTARLAVLFHLVQAPLEADADPLRALRVLVSGEIPADVAISSVIAVNLLSTDEILRAGRSS